MPTFATGLTFSWTADLLAIASLLGAARFFLALAGMDIGTSFGGIGSSREAMFGSFAEPATIMIVFIVSLGRRLDPAVGRGGLYGLEPRAARLGRFRPDQPLIVAIAENGRIPVDNPATHLELTMVHEAMILEYSGRHLAIIELASALKLLLYVSLIGCVFFPFGIASHDAGLEAMAISAVFYVLKLATAGFLLALLRSIHGEDARVQRSGISRDRADAGVVGNSPPLRHSEPLMHDFLSTSRSFSRAGWCSSASCCSTRTVSPA